MKLKLPSLTSRMIARTFTDCPGRYASRSVATCARADRPSLGANPARLTALAATWPFATPNTATDGAVARVLSRTWSTPSGPVLPTSLPSETSTSAPAKGSPVRMICAQTNVSSRDALMRMSVSLRTTSVIA